MTISEKQLAANRRNAQKSTGPRTAKGKAVSSRNATTHGLYSGDIIIKSPYLKESRKEYNRLLADLFDELQPTTMFQVCLVHKIASCLWRLRRVTRAENAQINRRLRAAEHNLKIKNRLAKLLGGDSHHPPTSRKQFNALLILSGLNDHTRHPSDTNFLRYETRLDRQLRQTYALLRMLQNQLSERTETAQKNNPTPQNEPILEAIEIV
jgi:hypothetical protein